MKKTPPPLPVIATDETAVWLTVEEMKKQLCNGITPLPRKPPAVFQAGARHYKLAWRPCRDMPTDLDEILLCYPKSGVGDWQRAFKEEDGRWYSPFGLLGVVPHESIEDAYYIDAAIIPHEVDHD